MELEVVRYDMKLAIVLTGLIERHYSLLVVYTVFHRKGTFFFFS